MTELVTLERPEAGHPEDESAKRRQIIDGARAMFLAKGFDAASMNDIARAAGVSKGTLYVYFKHKEELFEAIVGKSLSIEDFFRSLYVTDMWKDARPSKPVTPAYREYWRSKLKSDTTRVATDRVILVGAEAFYGRR